MHRIRSSEHATTLDTSSYRCSTPLWVPVLGLFLIWAIIVIVINPVGEFMVNDDWAFVRCLQSLMGEGSLPTTGHGPPHASGGPALITHLLWGLAFVKVAGFSITALRVSVLTLGILASFTVFFMLHRSGAPIVLCVLGPLCLMFNPLFLSQCFTYMTDVTFTSFALVSVLFFSIGVERTDTRIIVVGFIFALAATLTRQFGLVLPVGFVAACFLHKKGAELGRGKMVVTAMTVTVIPWMAYEIFLYWMGSTPIIRHNMLRIALTNVCSMDWRQYTDFLSRHLFVSTLGYVCGLISPVIALRYGGFWSKRSFRYFVLILTVALLTYETMYLLGMVDPPMILSRNVIFNLGIGPVVLKDTYIMGIERSATLPKALYIIIVYWTLIAAVVFIALVYESVRAFTRRDSAGVYSARNFLATQCLVTALVYLVIIVPLAPYDRYLILPCALLIIWIVASIPPHPEKFALSLRTAVPVLAPLLCLAVFSVLGTRDFFELKRSLTMAHDYALNELKVPPCNMDGGFEFNGYHCYKRGAPHRKDVSWWWVERERYLATLGTLPGYRVIRTFPFKRWLGPDGSVHLLEPTNRE